MFELLNLLAGFNDVVPHLADGVTLHVLESPIDNLVERSQGSPGDHGALKQSLIPHLEQSLGRHVGACTSLLPLPDDAFEQVDDLLVHLSDTQLHGILVLGLRFFVPFYLNDFLELVSVIIGLELIGQFGQNHLNSRQEVLLDITQ